MPVRGPDYERMIAEREAEAEAAEREGRRIWLVTLAVCLLWSAAGAAVTMAGFVIHDEELGPVLRDSGFGLAIGGNLLTLVVARAVRERRGLD